MAEEIAAPGWSSLPADLVNRVADCLLATNDLDCYTDLRAVCHHWPSVTADPRSNQHDPRFRPSRWVLLDEHKASASAAITVEDGALLFVNTATGRFVSRTLPLLRDPVHAHAFVTSTTDGLLVLAATDPPHAVSVLNPFTRSLIRFAAPLPSEPRPRLRLTADVVGPSPALVLVSVGSSWVYWAESQSESFSVEKSHRNCPASRLPQIIAAAGNRSAAINRESVPAGGAKNIFDELRSQLSQNEDCRCYTVVAAGGDMLAVLKRRDGMDVFKIDAAGNVMERVKSIDSQALFLGVRCLVVDTDCFPTVEPNCAYFQLIDLDDQRYIYKFNIGTDSNEEDPELVSAAMGYSTVLFCTMGPIGTDSNEEDPELVSAAMGTVPFCTMGPFTVTQLLCNYTMDIPGQHLTWEGYSYLELEDYYDRNGDYDKYMDYESGEDWGSDDYDYRSRQVYAHAAKPRAARKRNMTATPTSLRQAARPSNIPVAERATQKLMRELEFVGGQQQQQAPDKAVTEYIDMYAGDLPEKAIKAIQNASRMGNKKLAKVLAAMVEESDAVDMEV